MTYFYEHLLSSTNDADKRINVQRMTWINELSTTNDADKRINVHTTNRADNYEVQPTNDADKRIKVQRMTRMNELKYNE